MAAQLPPTPETYERADVGRAALWFALLGGAVAWLGHFLLAYAISEFGCVAGWGDVRWAGLSGVTWALIAVTVLAVAVAVLSILVAHLARRKLQDQPLDAPGEPGVAAAGRWMARAGFIAGVVSLVIILVQSIPILYWLGGC